ncbi:16S rRNA (uracil(1498)-N(3))-methyltransferase [Hydrogenophaga sp. IBVHS2]|uniref:16S rRNA (uracil(1498)-N(3))-methyltransferase n=1 Tax=Hydrogenophaga sp. IBVHS2 TaxID=1985170 RepID=UPI000A2D13A5|nr:16S rRNA (uracil(1498)-N(3))-methyltransferase [Hydrogenophaga sp. IBVHS2]OSZ64062.1 16S rRNA (uracil(1498)-N(3))-methyltransferase [Hydrogenophaga sp. IBVHS2]
MPRLYCPAPLTAGAEIDLPEGAARHVQVLRHQPGDAITLFDGRGGQWQASVLSMGRSRVQVRVERHEPIEREASRPVWLALGMPANERMDWLVEKATEVGVAGIVPLHTAHGVLRLQGERARKKQAHWQAVAQAACEQCGRNRLPEVQPVQELSRWLAAPQSGDPADSPLRCVLSLAEGTRPLTQVLSEVAADRPVVFLSGAEGGLSPAEDAQARTAGFLPVTLGPRILRAETAALAALSLAVL